MFNLRRKIVVKYISFLLIISVLPILAIGLISYQVSSETLKQVEADYSHVLLSDQRQLLEVDLKQVENLIANISSVESITQVLDDIDSQTDAYTNLATQARIGYILNGYLNLQGLVSIDIFTLGGAHYHVGDTLDISSIDKQTLQRIRYEVSQKQDLVHWAGVMPNVNTSSSHKFVLTAAKSLYKFDRKQLKNKAVALIMVNYSLGHLEKQFSRTATDKESIIALLDHNNNIVYSNLEPEKEKKIKHIINQSYSQGSQSEAISFEGEVFYIHHLSIEHLGWQLFSIIPEAALLKDVKSIRNMTTLLFIISFLVIGLAVWFFTRNIVKPIRDVVAGFSALQNHTFNLKTRLSIKTNDEVGELVNWFNKFLDNLAIQRRSEKALKISESYFKALSEVGFEAIFISDKGVCLGQNFAAEKLFGFSATEASGKAVLDWFVPESKKLVRSNIEAGFEEPFEVVALRKDGSEFAAEIHTKMSDYQESRVLVIALHDITERKRADDELRKLSFAVKSSSSAILIADLKGNIEFINPKYTQITGYKKAEATGLNLRILNAEEMPEKVYEDLWATISSGSEWKGKLKSQKKNGQLYWSQNSISGVKNTAGEITHYIVVQDDVTHEYEMSEQLNFQASHDPLTGLINRREFERRAQRLLASYQKDMGEHAMCFLDLDQFKIINDTCGHIAGDELLSQISEVLLNTVRNRDTLARLGGDEFGILMEHCTLEQAQRVANEILKNIRNYQLVWEGQSYRVGISIGLVAITGTTFNLSELLKQADAACYMAKEHGRNRIHIYHPADNELVQRQGEVLWVNRINRALEDNSFCLYAQPIVSLSSEKDKHYELLVRLQDEDGSIIPPGAFLPAAERYNLMYEIDEWVIKNAFSLLASNPNFVEDIHFISINLSGASLTNKKFLDTVITQLKTSNIDASKICFEITETVAISNLKMATHFISVLKEIGCNFALDDFGSGLSSFGYLKNLPVDYLKIDGMFVRDIVNDEISRAMVKSINEIGQLMKMGTIAEYVENNEIKHLLEDMGVNYVQGYGIGKPVPFLEVLKK
ncbi:MAG: EAL domain-containing protein [Gammaproteobacteria bacterium]|nr:EAL domain-containing protein [Gammaproteobacteria bacterium]